MEWTVWPALWVVYGSPCAVVLLSRCARGRCAGLGERGCHSSWDGEGGEVGAGEVCHALEWDTRAASGLRGAAYARNTHYAPGLGCEKPGAPPMGFGPRGDSYTQSRSPPPPSSLGLLPSQPSQMSAIIFVFFGDPSVDQSSAP